MPRHYRWGRVLDLLAFVVAGIFALAALVAAILPGGTGALQWIGAMLLEAIPYLGIGLVIGVILIVVGTRK